MPLPILEHPERPRKGELAHQVEREPRHPFRDVDHGAALRRFFRSGRAFVCEVLYLSCQQLRILYNALFVDGQGLGAEPAIPDAATGVMGSDVAGGVDRHLRQKDVVPGRLGKLALGPVDEGGDGGVDDRELFGTGPDNRPVLLIKIVDNEVVVPFEALPYVPELGNGRARRAREVPEAVEIPPVYNNASEQANEV